MVSPEILRRYSFFSFLEHDQLAEIAMLTEEVAVPRNNILFSIHDKAEALYFLQSGSVDLHYVVVDERLPELRKDFHIGTINPGEIFGISSLIEPYKLTTTAVTTTDCILLKIEASGLYQLCEKDRDLAYGLQKQIAQIAMERLHNTRILLAAATAPV